MITRNMKRKIEDNSEANEEIDNVSNTAVRSSPIPSPIRKKVRKIYEDDSFSIQGEAGGVDEKEEDEKDTYNPGKAESREDDDINMEDIKILLCRRNELRDKLRNDSEDENDRDSKDFSNQVSSENQDLYDKLKRRIKKQNPSMNKILSASVSNKHKIELLQLFFIYDTEYPNSDGKLMYQEKINNLIKKYEKEYKLFKTLTDDEKKNIKKELKILQNYDEKLSLENQIALLPADLSIKQVIYREYKRLGEIRFTDDEYPKLKDWLYKCLSIPFNSLPIRVPQGGISSFISSAKSLLDKKLYGMNNVKEQILLYLNAKINKFENKHNVLGLLGPPGVGKTAIARSLSEILNLPFAQISCTNIKDISVLRGHSYTYIGSKCGEILESVIKLKSKTGIIFLDEFGLISNDEIVSTFLDILDPVQNKEYYDIYVGREIPIDLSGIWFIVSMNDLPSNNALQDRIFPINVKGYNREEKCAILKNYIIPKLLDEVNCREFMFPENTVQYIVDKFGKKEPGLRGILYNAKNIIHKLAFLKSNNVEVSYRIRLDRIITTDIVNKLSDKDDKDNIPYQMYG